MGKPDTFSALRRLLTAADAPHLRCQLCGTELTGEHAHVVETATRQLLCACGPCACAPTQHQSIRPMSNRYVRDGAMRLTTEQWAALDIPVDLAFFFFNAALGRFVVSYPGPAGVVESALPLGWQAFVEDHPWARSLDADVEAVLARRTGDGYQCLVIPIDRCYELVGRIRRAWSGLGGGDHVHREVEMFFSDVIARCGVPA